MRRGKKRFARAALVGALTSLYFIFPCSCSNEVIVEPEPPFYIEPDEIGKSPLTPPELQAKSFTSMVTYTYTAENSSVLRLSQYPSIEEGVSVNAVNGVSAYSAVIIPDAGSSFTKSPFRYARSYYRDSDGTLWTSGLCYLYREAESNRKVLATYTSGTILTSYQAFRLDAEKYDSVYITAAYKGECADFTYGGVVTALTVYERLSDEAKIEVGGITFYFRLREGTIQIRASRRVSLGDSVNSLSDFGAISLSKFDRTALLSNKK